METVWLITNKKNKIMEKNSSNKAGEDIYEFTQKYTAIPFASKGMTDQQKLEYIYWKEFWDGVADVSYS